MTQSKRFTLVFAIAILAFTSAAFAPATFAGSDEVPAPSALEMLLQAFADIFLPAAETPVEPGEVNSAGPNIIFIG